MNLKLLLPLFFLMSVTSAIHPNQIECFGVIGDSISAGFSMVSGSTRALKLAGESAESGSMICWKVLTNLLEFNASNKDPFDDGIEVNETDAGVRLHIGIIGKYEDDYDDTNVSKFIQKIIARMIKEENIGQRQLFFPL